MCGIILVPARKHTQHADRLTCIFPKENWRACRFFYSSQVHPSLECTSFRRSRVILCTTSIYIYIYVCVCISQNCACLTQNWSLEYDCARMHAACIHAWFSLAFVLSVHVPWHGRTMGAQMHVDKSSLLQPDTSVHMCQWKEYTHTLIRIYRRIRKSLNQHKCTRRWAQALRKQMRTTWYVSETTAERWDTSRCRVIASLYTFDSPNFSQIFTNDCALRNVAALPKSNVPYINDVCVVNTESRLRFMRASLVPFISKLFLCDNRHAYACMHGIFLVQADL